MEWHIVYVWFCQMRHFIIRDMQQSNTKSSLNKKSPLAHAQGWTCYRQVSWLELVQGILTLFICIFADNNNFVAQALKNASSDPAPFQNDLHPKSGKVNFATCSQITYRKEEGQGSPLSFSIPPQVPAGRSESCVSTIHLIISYWWKQPELIMVKRSVHVHERLVWTALL